jgi:hypothetical protein
VKENDKIDKFNGFSYTETVIREIANKDDEYTKQVIKDYFTKRYPKENLRFDFLDKEIVDEVIKLGMAEYKRRKVMAPKAEQIIYENYIPVQKIKDKIEKLKEKGESDFRSYGFAVETHLALQILQELLESEE